MFPKPHDALPLPLRPNLEQYKKLAKDLVRAHRSDEPDAMRCWAANWVERLVSQAAFEPAPGIPVRIEEWTSGVTRFATQELASARDQGALAAAQFVLARSHGFESWTKFAEALDRLAGVAVPPQRPPITPEIDALLLRFSTDSDSPYT